MNHKSRLITTIFWSNIILIVMILMDRTEEVKSRKKLDELNRHTMEVTQRVIDSQMRAAQEIASLLDSCDVDAAEQAAFDNAYLEQFGAVGLDAALIADQKRFVIVTENVTVNVDPDRSDLVEVKRVDGRRAITIWVEGDITVNGIEVSL